VIDKDSLYAVALLALWLPPEWCGYLDEQTGRTKFLFMDHPSSYEGHIELEHSFTLASYVVVACSQEEAKEKSLTWLRDLYPEEDGWVSHVAYAQIVDIGPTIDAKLVELGIVKDNADVESESSAGDESELIM
jgi:hypothetical protein